jgi:hypothetical protein
MCTLIIAEYMIDAVTKISETEEMSRREDLCLAVLLRFRNTSTELIKELERTKEILAKDWSVRTRVLLSGPKQDEMGRRAIMVRNLRWLRLISSTVWR